MFLPRAVQLEICELLYGLGFCLYYLVLVLHFRMTASIFIIRTKTCYAAPWLSIKICIYCIGKKLTVSSINILNLIFAKHTKLYK
jgi:hypothetical protein